ncbi:MAG: hypothetical protein K0R00_64 [Herbinix sp.]|jgi:hypothetical protein|nr:hypothetical protein [Herbinix sp.]
MIVIGQDEREHETREVEQKGLKIYCIPGKDRRKKELVGEYKDLMRACEVFASIYVANKDKQASFTMPKE